LTALVNAHATSIYSKLGVTSQAMATRVAVDSVWSDISCLLAQAHV